MFTIDQITTFDHEICDDNGTVYPVGTRFMVREVTLLDDPIISIYVDESDSADGNYSEPLNEFMYAEYPYQVHTDGAIRIDDTENSEELYGALNKAQTDNKKVYIKKGVVRFGISVIVFVVGLALFAVFNCYSNIEQKTKKNIMIGIIFLCVAIVLIIFCVLIDDGNMSVKCIILFILSRKERIKLQKYGLLKL